MRRFKSKCGYLARHWAVRDNDELMRIKKTINPALICLTPMGTLLKNCELTNVNHIDIHSAYPAFLCKAHPEFYEYFNELYEGRHAHTEYKCYLNYCVGAMQSPKISGNRYPELARDGINGTREYLLELTERMTKKGFTVLGYNTDGIFYSHPLGLEYHDADEGDGMGQ